jgi:hypothetical protein
MIDWKSDLPVEFVIGRLYHCSWAKNRGFVWKLVAFDQEKNEAHLITPKTHKSLKTQLSSLRDTNKNLKPISKS